MSPKGTRVKERISSNVELFLWGTVHPFSGTSFSENYFKIICIIHSYTFFKLCKVNAYIRKLYSLGYI